MCQSRPEQTELTQEYLDSLATLAHSTVPSKQELRASALPHGWQVEEGQTPAPLPRRALPGRDRGRDSAGTFGRRNPTPFHKGR